MMPRKCNYRYKCMDCGETQFSYVGNVSSRRSTGREHCRHCGSTFLVLDSRKRSELEIERSDGMESSFRKADAHSIVKAPKDTTDRGH